MAIYAKSSGYPPNATHRWIYAKQPGYIYTKE